MRWISVIIALVLLTACELDHSNPLENESAPPQVSNLQIAASGAGATEKYVRLSWDKLDNVEGYYVYWALSYNGSYQNLVSMPNDADSDSLAFEHHAPVAGYNYYRVSAYKPSGLEGRRSNPIGIRVN